MEKYTKIKVIGKVLSHSKLQIYFERIAIFVFFKINLFF
jgi:hypothetical protein